MKENGKISALFSWPVIILALCLFWPIGLFLIIKRISVDKKLAMKLGEFAGYFGGFSYAIAILGIISSIDNGFDSNDASMILFFGVSGFLLRKFAKKAKAEGVQMIEKDHLDNAYIDENMRKAVLSDGEPTTPVFSNYMQDAEYIEQKTKVVVCRCCGASNTVNGISGECEYCGSPIK